jgi:hypothetical protein
VNHDRIDGWIEIMSVEEGALATGTAASVDRAPARSCAKKGAEVPPAARDGAQALRRFIGRFNGYGAFAELIAGFLCLSLSEGWP